MLRNGGQLGEAPLAVPRTIALMIANHLPPGIQYGPDLLLPFADLAPSPVTGSGFGQGFAARAAEGRSPVPGNIGDYFWAGAYGTHFWVDPKEELYAVLMLQGPSDRIQACRSTYTIRHPIWRPFGFVSASNLMTAFGSVSAGRAASALLPWRG